MRVVEVQEDSALGQEFANYDVARNVPATREREEPPTGELALAVGADESENLGSCSGAVRLGRTVRRVRRCLPECSLMPPPSSPLQNEADQSEQQGGPRSMASNKRPHSSLLSTAAARGSRHSSRWGSERPTGTLSNFSSRSGSRFGGSACSSNIGREGLSRLGSRARKRLRTLDRRVLANASGSTGHGQRFGDISQPPLLDCHMGNGRGCCGSGCSGGSVGGPLGFCEKCVSAAQLSQESPPTQRPAEEEMPEAAGQTEAD